MKNNISNAALLVMDMQTSILSNLSDSTSLLENVGKSIVNARENNIPVIYVVVGFRAGAPEISLDNKAFSAYSDKNRWSPASAAEWLKIHPAISPRENEPIVIKRRVSAFTGSDLEVILRAQNIRHLILTGIATSGVVLSTVREAADKDFRLTILSDCCADADEEVHLLLTTKIFPRQAEVLKLAEWIQT